MVHGEEMEYSFVAEQIALTAQQGPVLAGFVDCWGEDDFKALMLAVPQRSDVETITKEILNFINK